MRPFRNTFSWSISRHRAFETCRRQYWYLYYGHWGGWERGAPEPVRTVYMLKNMTNLALWVGTVVHDTLERYLKSRRNFSPLGLAELLELQRDRMREDYRQSLRGDWRDQPKRATHFFEHYHGVEVTPEQWRERAEAADRMVEAFWNGPVRSRVEASDPNRDWLAVEDRHTLDLDGTPVWVVPDFATRDGDGVVLYDWKTGGKAEINVDQLVIYSLFAMKTWEVPLEHLRIALYYLADGTLEEKQVSQSQIDGVRERARNSIRAMRELLVDPEENEARMEDFEFTTRSGECARCFFQTVCPGFRSDPDEQPEAS